MIKKAGLFLFLFFLISFVSAIPDLDIEKTPVNSVYIRELRKPAIFELTIRNLGNEDNFEIYSLSGLTIYPKTPFKIKSGETKKITIEVFPQQPILDKNSGFVTFNYKIRGQDSGILEDKLTIKLIDLNEAFTITFQNIEPDNEKAVFSIQNNENINFENIKAKFASAFFGFEQEFSLEEYGKKTFEVILDKNKTKKLIAGSYVLTSQLEVNEKTAEIQTDFRFKEKPGIITNEENSGIIILTTEIEKINDGNLPVISEIKIQKNAISRLFTSFSESPDLIERQGFNVDYTWQKEIKPSEIHRIRATTNWLLPILIIIALIIITYLIKVYFSRDIEIRKKVIFVKTKGGEFALKVILNISSNKYVENIKVIDKLPPLVKLYERYGTITPDNVDEKNKRLEWQIEKLNEKEERVFSYVIYSKVGIMGKFALPKATAVYEREGEIKETDSNKVFFIAEQKNEEQE